MLTRISENLKLINSLSTTAEDSCDDAKKVACVDSQTSVSPTGVTAVKPVVTQILSSSSK